MSKSHHTENPAPSEKKIAGRDLFLAPRELAIEEVAIPEWGEGVVVRVREMTGRAHSVWVDSIVENTGKGQKTKLVDADAKIVVATVVDENGALIFDESDVATLSTRLGASIIGRIAEVGRRLSALNKDDADAAAKK